MKKVIIVVLVLFLTFPVISEAQTCLTVNIAKNKAVSVSAQNQFHEGAAAVDENLNTDWSLSSSTTDAWIYVDLVESYDVCKIKITWSNAGRGSDYKVQTSTNATSWTDIFTRTGNTNDIDVITATGTGRYVRILMTAKVNSWSGYEMKELEINNSEVGNTPPTVSITGPANSAAFTTGTNISLSANAADANGSVTKVEFYQGTTKLGESLTSPFSYTWFNVPAGSYALTAKAIDNDNATTTSAAVNITVAAATTGNGWLLNGNNATTPGANFLGTTDDQRLVFKTNNTEKMTILSNGYVGINMANPVSELTVNGTITAKKMKVTQLGWADYVFEKEYKLMSLPELETYIRKHQHLPGVATTAEVQKNGTDVAEIQATLLQKIEELTLYLIEQNKKIEKQQWEIEQLKKQKK